jgi:hypothetical protein
MLKTGIMDCAIMLGCIEQAAAPEWSIKQMASDPFPPELPTSLWGLLSAIFGGLAFAVGTMWRALTKTQEQSRADQIETRDLLLAQQRQTAEALHEVARTIDRQTDVAERERRK